MGKQRKTLHVRIPPYLPPRNSWRRAIHAAVMAAAKVSHVRYAKGDKLQLDIFLYLPPDAMGWHDVDNRLKDIMDALQGRAGGPKNEHRLHALIPNDHQIHKVTIEKKMPPAQSLGLGHLTIRRYRASA